jgi:hypothetical protein
MLDSNPSMGAGASRFLVQDKVDANIAYAQGHGMPLQLGSLFGTLRVDAGCATPRAMADIQGIHEVEAAAVTRVDDEPGQRQ